MGLRAIFKLCIGLACLWSCDGVACPKVGLISEGTCVEDVGDSIPKLQPDPSTIAYVNCFQDCAGDEDCERVCEVRHGSTPKEKYASLISCVDGTLNPDQPRSPCYEIEGAGALNTNCISSRCRAQVEAIYGANGVFVSEDQNGTCFDAWNCFGDCLNDGDSFDCGTVCFGDMSYRSKQLMNDLLQCNVGRGAFCDFDDEDCLLLYCPSEYRYCSGLDLSCAEILRCFNCDRAAVPNCFDECTSISAPAEEASRWVALTECTEASPMGNRCLFSLDCLNVECPNQYRSCIRSR